MEKIKNVLLQLSSNGNRMIGEIERQKLQSEKASNIAIKHVIRPVYSDTTQLNSTRRRVELSCVAINAPLVIFRFVRLNSCTPRQLGLPVRKTESSGLAVVYFGRL